MAAIRYEVEAVDGRRVRVVVQSELVANEPCAERSEDPRAAAALRARWWPRSRRSTTCGSCSCTARSQSGLRMAAGMDHVIEDADGIDAGAEAEPTSAASG